MLLPMSPTDAIFLLGESREHPMHVGSLQLFQPPDGMDALDVRSMLDDAIAADEVAPLFRKRARRSITSLGQWGWEPDEEFDLEHHVRRNALPQPGRVLELLALCSRLHSTLLDRHRPLWEMHLVEGLDDGRYAMYMKVHHSMMDGVSALRMLSRMLTDDPELRDMPAPWAPRAATKNDVRCDKAAAPNPLRSALGAVGEATGLVPALVRTLTRGVSEQSGSMSLSAPQDDAECADHRRASLRGTVVADGADPSGRQGHQRDGERRRPGNVLGSFAFLSAEPAGAAGLAVDRDGARLAAWRRGRCR